MSLQNELSEIKKKKFQSVYTLIGTETFLSETFKKELKKQVSDEEDDDFNIVGFDMNEVELSNVIHEAETVPFFGDHKVIFVENPYFLTGEKKRTELNHDLTLLESYLSNPLSTSILVFMASYDKLDERKKVVKLLKKESKVVDVSKMTEKTLIPYLRQYIENEGYDIEKSAFEELVYLTDMDLSRIMNELDKLFLYSLESKVIKKSDVSSLIPKSLEHNIFDLNQYVLKNKADQSLNLYHELLISGEETIKIISILLGQIRLLLQVKILLDMNYQQSNMTDTLKIHPYRIKLAVGQSKTLSFDILGQMFNELIEMDFKIKTGQMDKELVFELFLLQSR
ncbi:DNA polymerase III subunit delta [Vagococcus sp.]|uniref:DNA polymerase III subunit delta n=1 Tax=Vagococcus sp. TaxID=1933889 RepID=UPI002FCB0985